MPPSSSPLSLHHRHHHNVSPLMATASSSSYSAKDPSPSPSPPPPSSIPTVTIAATATTADGSPDLAHLALHAPPPPPPSSSSRRLPPPCWTNEETLALIDSYREKWYALRRGNLRAPHWQEVADAVASRCLRLPTATPKTSVQCRHKVEKLRKRYRAEKTRSLCHNPSGPPSSSWVFFRKMDGMEHGGGGAAAGRPGSRSSPSRTTALTRSDNDDVKEHDDEDENRGGGRGRSGNTRSLHRLMANGGGGGGEISGLRFTIPKAVRSKKVGSRVEERAVRSQRLNPNPSNRFFKGYDGAMPGREEIRRKVEKRRRKEREPDAADEMASALRMLGDGFMRVEKMKLDMAREMEKVRMEMELKRTEMILNSQRQTVDAFVKGFFGKKRASVSLG